ncbi:MAG TPA: class I SAM-dependent methyltransferase [Thermoanaerobaculia bacterium]|nr:class I SAM-dependent methyltransferase [Thermoanaerobaculia bacterium]
MVDTLLRTRVPRWEELNRAIDERDDMLDFGIKLFEHDRDRALTSYFQNGMDQFALVRHIAGWRGSIGPVNSRPVRRMLDFASGYGRLTRFLVHEKLAGEVTVCDILEGGMAFQAEQFEVRTILSKTDPDDLVTPSRYDLIFVASLFTHLPPATFTRWLRRLAELLEPEGLLIFSVHDESIAPARVEGIHFTSDSESRVLDGEEYGSTWVTEGYVREQVAALTESDVENFACVRLPRALADWQDVYVVSPAPLPDARPRRTPKGFVDQFAITADGVQISGWATAVAQRADRVEIHLDDEIVATTRDFAPRPDVAAWLGVPSAADSGWQCVVPHEKIRSYRYQVATVSAFSPEGNERILFLGTLEALNGQVARDKAKALEQQLALRGNEIDALSEELSAARHATSVRDQQIAAMQQSRFWKAREQWFSLKRAVGWTDER